MAILKQYDNGFRLIHQYDNTTRGVSICFACLVGGKDEDNSNRGIAHLAEHMFFKGTAKRKSLEINGELDKRGIINNASTSNNITKYDAEGIDEHAEIIFDIFSDCLFNSLYPADELEKEKKVVCSELEMYESDFRDKVESLGTIISLQGTEYAYNLGGTVESVSKITTEDLIKFRNQFYVPERIIVSVVGNITLEETERLMQKYVLVYGKENKEPETYCKEPIEIDIKQRLLFESKDTDQVYAMINFRSVNASAPDLEAFKLAKMALASTGTSRLFIKLREERGLVYAVYCYFKPYAECGMNAIHFISSDKNAREVVEVIKATVDEILQNGFTQEELETYKNILKTNLILSVQTLTDKAYVNLREVIYKNKLFNLDEQLEKINKVTLKDMNEAFKKYFDYNYLTVGLIAKENNLDVLKLLGRS